MTIRKIGDLPKPGEGGWRPAACFSREHNPPTHMYLENGIYEHTCPACGKRIEFVVNNQMIG